MKHISITSDVIIEMPKGIILIERKNPPYGWAIPGGFVEYGESVEETAIREMKEETCLELKDLRQFHVYSDLNRDPRGHTITVVFTAKGVGKLNAGDDAGSISVFGKDDLPMAIAFDHRQILEDYFKGKNNE